MLSGLLGENGTDNGEDISEEERSPNTDDLLNAISPINEDETASAKQVDTVNTAGKQDEAVITAEDFEDYIQVVQNNNSEIRFWYDAKEFPDLTYIS
jgi:hypothetical protein